MAGEVGVAGLASLILNRGGFKIKPYASRVARRRFNLLVLQTSGIARRSPLEMFFRKIPYKKSPP